MAFSTYFDLLCSHKYFDRLMKYFNSKYGTLASSPVEGATTSGKPATETFQAPEGMTKEQSRSLIDRFLAQQGREKTGEQREPRYGSLIKRYYMIDNGGSTGSIITSDHVAALINNKTHIEDIYESLKKEFGMGKRGAELAPYSSFLNSIQTQKQGLMALSQYRMDAVNPNAVPGDMFEELRTLFQALEVVPSSRKTKLVAVSKTLHFLLPDLVMPIDSKVLRFLRKGDIPPKTEKQFE